MKRDGATSPWTGWRQRTSASMPLMRVPRQADQGLVMQLEFVARDGLAQLLFEGGPGAVAGVHLGREEAEAAAVALDLVHGHAGVLDQVFGAVAVLRVDRDPQAEGWR
jgi:hypothetical protein